MSSGATSAASAPLAHNTNDESIVNANTIIKLIKQLSFFFFIYLLGYFGFSATLVYIILALLIYHDRCREQKEEKLQVARAMALGFEKEIILNRLSELPSWVKFSDIEKVEWLNKLFKQIWQQINEYAHDLVPKILEPAIQDYVSDFKFSHVVLGNVPLRVDGIHVYDQEDKRKIIMDLDISYAGDCYVTFQTYRFTGGIRDIHLHGRLRVVLTPLVSRIPLIGGVQAYFMNPPEIDFDLIKATQILDVPVIRNRIKSTALNVINSRFLYPNAYSINLTQGVNMSKLAVFRTEGILRVHVVEAKNLVNKDIIGKSDPYVVLSVGSIKVETPVIQNSLNPKWDFWREFEIEPNSELKIEVWDKDEGSKDDFLGHAKIGISEIAKTGQAEMAIPLQGVAKGTIYMRFTWLSLSQNYLDLEAAIKEIEYLSPNLHTALLMIYLDSSLGLPVISKLPPSAYVALEVENQKRETDVEHGSCEPLWDKGFTFLLRDVKKAILHLRIYDEDSKKQIGVVSFKVDNLQTDPKLELRRHTFFFNKPNSDASICCSMKLRILKNEAIKERREDEQSAKPRKHLVKQESNVSTKSNFSQISSVAPSEIESVMSDETNSESLSFVEDEGNSSLGKIKLSLSYSQQRQKLVIEVHEVSVVPKRVSDTLAPYVKLYLQLDRLKNNKRKTKTVKHSHNPTFNEKFEYLISSQDLAYMLVVLVVETEKGLFDIRKRFLGQTIIALRMCQDLSEPFTDWFHLKSKHDSHVYHLIK